jgi:PAS domain S-box-containing protein
MMTFEGMALSNALEKVLHDAAVDFRVPERVLRTVVEDMPDRLLLLDLNLTVRFANRGIFDTPREQLSGRCILDFIPGQEHERVRAIYEQAIADRAPKVYELRQQVRGETRWFENRIGPVMHEGRVFAFDADGGGREGVLRHDWSGRNAMRPLLLASLVAAVVGGSIAMQPSASAQGSGAAGAPADIILINGKVITVDDQF